MITIYMKRGCPYCQKVLNFIDNKGLKNKVKIHYVEEDFSYQDFKKKYGQNATFPRGYLDKNGKITLIGGSDDILNELEKHS